MDAASHRGIDDVRSLRDAVKLSPTKSKKKIYIIDEAHMLTTEASNALLKTLEEPPEHVIFILATTNPEKLIDTIRSRTTLITFRKAKTDEIVRSLKRAVVGEKIKINDELLNKIATLSGGAFRDAIKILEQFSLEGEDYLNSFKTSELTDFINFLIKRDEKGAIEEIEKNNTLGISMDGFLSELLETFHKAILSSIGIGEVELKGLEKEDLIILSELFMEASKKLADSPVEELPVEIAVMKWCGEVGSEPQITNSKKNSHPASGGADGNIQESSAESEKSFETKIDTIIQDTQTISSSFSDQAAISSDGVGMVNDDIWKNILLAIHPVNASIEALLRSSRPVGYDGKTLTLGVFYKFHKERLEDTHHRKILEETIEKVLNSPTKIVCTLVDPPPKKIIEEAKVEPVLTEGKDADIIKAAEEIFGN